MIALVIPGVAAFAQSPDPPLTDAAVQSPKRVFLLTVGPGEHLEERFGHNAIWIHDETTGLDNTYHWGNYDFKDPGFVWRFFRGQMMYSTAEYPLDATIASSAAAGREVRIQELAFTADQIAELEELIRINHLPENREYRYDYYLDNCSTRVRDLLDRVAGGAIRAQTDQLLTGSSYRSLSLQHLWDQPLISAGVQLLLGHPGDQKLTQWDEMFLPAQLAEYITSVTVPTGADGVRPLVAFEDTVVESIRDPLPTTFPRRVLLFLVLGTALGFAFAVLGRSAAQGARWSRRGFFALGVGWCLVAGIASLLLVWLTFFSEHIFAYRNENFFQFEPLSLVLLGWLVLFGRARPLNPRIATTAWVIVALSVMGFALQLLPGFDQINGEIVALALPVHLGLAVGITRIRSAAS